jgi:hypothetical protein
MGEDVVLSGDVDTLIEVHENVAPEPLVSR